MHMGKGLLLKLPNGYFVNGSFFFRYSFADNCTICLASIVNSADFDVRLREVFSRETSDEAPRIRRPDPFIFLSLLFEHFSMQMENERESMDRRVCVQESRSGVKVHAGFQNIGQAKIGEYAIVKRDLHLTEASMAILLSILEFQEQLADFLLAEHAKLAKLDKEYPLPRGATLEISEFARVDASLSLTASMARCRLEQVRVLSKRVQIQLRLVRGSRAHGPNENALMLYRPRVG
jgi:hypothetical protein